MLRLVATSILEALGIVLCAVLFVFATAYFVEKDALGITPLLLLVVYPLPVWIAAARRHNETVDIMIINMWLGWTVVFWLAALMRACYGDTRSSAEELPLAPETTPGTIFFSFPFLGGQTKRTADERVEAPGV